MYIVVKSLLWLKIIILVQYASVLMIFGLCEWRHFVKMERKEFGGQLIAKCAVTFAKKKTWNSQNLAISQEILRKSEEMQKFLKIWIVRKNTKKRAKEIWNLGMWRNSEEIWEIPQKFNTMEVGKDSRGSEVWGYLTTSLSRILYAYSSSTVTLRPLSMLNCEFARFLNSYSTIPRRTHMFGPIYAWS